jgi:hypothetical protein
MRSKASLVSISQQRCWRNWSCPSSFPSPQRVVDDDGVIVILILTRVPWLTRGKCKAHFSSLVFFSCHVNRLFDFFFSFSPHVPLQLYKHTYSCTLYTSDEILRVNSSHPAHTCDDLLPRNHWVITLDFYVFRVSGVFGWWVRPCMHASTYMSVCVMLFSAT